MADPTTDGDSEYFQRCSSDFLKWFESNPDTRTSKKITLADLRSRNARRGVLANDNISVDEELFAVPRSLVLHKASSELYHKIPGSFAHLGPWDSLIIVIIYEFLRGDASPWFPYLQLLPTTFDTLMFWTPEELSELRGSAVVDKIGREAAEENWSKTIIQIMLSNEELFPVPASDLESRESRFLELAHMAGSMIMAYAFDIEDESGKNDEDAADDGESDLTEDDEDNPAKAMVPFADMLNADANRNNARLFHEDHFLIMKATKDIKSGDDIFNDYGPLPRSDLLRMYGYITDNYSAFDVVEISANLLENVAASSGMNRSCLTKKREELERLGMIDDAFVLGRPEAGLRLQDLVPVDLRMLITAFCQPAEKFNPSKLSNLFKESGLGLSEASLLSASIINRLSDYKTSPKEDSETLAMLKRGESLQPPRFSCKRYEMAVQVRRGEKEILHRFLHLINEFVAEETQQMTEESSKRKRNEKDSVAAIKKPIRK